MLFSPLLLPSLLLLGLGVLFEFGGQEVLNAGGVAVGDVLHSIALLGCILLIMGLGPRTYSNCYLRVVPTLPTVPSVSTIFTVYTVSAVYTVQNILIPVPFLVALQPVPVALQSAPLQTAVQQQVGLTPVAPDIVSTCNCADRGYFTDRQVSAHSSFPSPLPQVVVMGI